ncbi:FAD-linked oxidoreductase-like protein [Kickxella alabastrina]|uniref:FAD-linked oxidoreductase-like protein n=1 Tax=Kickxella alabastrina TaxID=61397 RepID=UPI002220E1D9|nr:FAD-linked oxidoreductase-like protein [Kickxella alabastrina]KAI7827875.1 FAD-linked oxidoreductase-like protein [Kickxella alabastrina]
MPISASPVVTAFIRSSAAASAPLRGRLHTRAAPAVPCSATSTGLMNSSLQQHKAAAMSLAVRGISTSPTPPRTEIEAASEAGRPPNSTGDQQRLLQPDPALALDQLSMAKLITVWLVYRACGNARLVQAAPSILKLFERLGLSWLSNAVVRRTFLHDSGIGSILDFSAEADLEETAAADAEAARAHANVKADAFTKEYLHGLHMARRCPAIKVTGLTDPEVLYRLSMPYARLRAAFDKAASNGDGSVGFAQFRDTVLAAMPGGRHVASPASIFAMVDGDNDGQMALGMDNPLARPLYLRSSPGSEYGALESDVDDYERLLSRARAVDRGVRVMVDAEHTYFQPMIDHVALVMQREFNGPSTGSAAGAAATAPASGNGGTLVYNTIQMYRSDSFQRLVDDYARSQREGWRYAAKLVRGAYMELEHERAAKLGYPSPINPTLEATHACYDRGVRLLIDRIAEAQRSFTGDMPPALFIASHNNASIERAMQLLRELDIDTSAEPVMFGQLLGMQDATSYALAKAQLPIYKYVPYGSLEEVMPYLIRRAQENSAVGASIAKEASSVMAEIRRRMLGRAKTQPQTGTTTASEAAANNSS